MKLLKKVNLPLLILPILIFTLGYVTLLSTAPGLSSAQLIFFIEGLVLYTGFALFDYRLLKYYWKYFLIFVLLLLSITSYFGNEILGSRRWLEIGSFTFQPSEVAKLALVISLSAFLVSKRDAVNNVKELAKTLLIVIPLFIAVILQPDLGTAIIILAVFIGILFYAGLKKIYFLLGFFLLGIFSTPLWNILRDYQKRRILVFLNPSMDVLGAGYNVIQSMIAVGSGGLLGMGFGRGTQSHLQFLPIFWTDFIFASYAEEWGFVGVVILFLLYIPFLYAILKVSEKSADAFGSLFSLGVFVIFFVQLAVNIGMNLGLMPVTGIPLPLVSYGGSSLIISMVLLGLVQSVWLHKPGD